MSPTRMAAANRLWMFRCAALIGSATIAAVTAIGLVNLYAHFGPSPADRTAARFDSAWNSLPEATKTLLRAGGYGSRNRLVLPANFDGALVFTRTVMEPCPQRGYRFRPRQQNLWVLPPGMPNQVLVPDFPQVREALRQSNTGISSTERINSLGCRGPEPGDVAGYDFRVLVLGDSFAEGILVNEEDTFSSRLQQRLSEATGRNTLVVNSGVIGYSTEQEFVTLQELSPKIRPHVVVLCFYANDVHRNHVAVLNEDEVVGDWAAAEKWLQRSAAYCRANRSTFAVAIIPDRIQMARSASRRPYQHKLEGIASKLGIYLIDPHERFLARQRESLWLTADAHFSPAGHALFAEALADHVRHWTPQQAAR